MPPKRGRGRGRGRGGHDEQEGPPGRFHPGEPQQRGRGGPDRQEGPHGRFDPGDHHQPPQQRGGIGSGQHRQPPQQSGEVQHHGREFQQRGPPPGFDESPRPQQEQAYPVAHHEKQEQPKKKYQSVAPEEVGLELKHKLAITSALPHRPDEGGKLGRRIRLVSNCFPVKLPTGYIYHYDVAITIKKKNVESDSAVPAGSEKTDKKYRCLSTKRNREIINLMLKSDENFKGLYPAYDGQKNLYTRKYLNISNQLKCQVVIPGDANPNDPRGPRNDEFEVVIKPVKKKDTDTCAISLDTLHALFEGKISTVPQETVMAVETVLRHGPCLKFTPIGRSFFYPPHPQDIHPLGGGKEIWFGYHQSLRLGQWKPLINLDITATTFFQKGPVLRYVADILGMTVDDLHKKPFLSDAEIKRITGELKNLRIEVNHLRNYKRKYRILRMTKERADRLKFSYMEKDKTVEKTVAEYFKTHHKRALEFPHLPCLQVNPETKKVYLPIEVCDMIEGQHCKKKLEERQNAEMIKFTARAPKERFNEIEDIVRRADYSHDAQMREFGMTVVCEPLKLEGRVIEAPNVRYDNEERIKPRDGSWDMRNKQFFRGAEVNSWVLLSFANGRYCRDDKLNNFAQLLCKIARETGINMPRPSAVEIIDDRRANIKNVLENMKRRFNADLAVIVVPGNNKAVYGEVKQAAETILGLTTQCIKDESVVKKCNPPLVSNLCQKINAKMGGVNNSLTPGETPAILRRPIIIIGADVTHPSPSHDIKPSLAAAVGSLDSHPSRYAVTIRAQTNVDKNKQAIEIILDLKSMVVDLLKAFYKNTKGKKPEKIIFYRDGVSEGQFDKVKDHEVKCIREACRGLSADYEPGITFIVVQKRHHTRFMPQDSREGVGRMKNVPPGTTVDTAVTHPLNFDFFLCSHFGLQGTSRPSHYTVIEDDNEFTSDDLQKLTYYLCHTYVRCTKSISTPAPVQYAHLAAFRARQHLLTQVDESTSSETSSMFHPLPEAVINAIKVVDGLKSTMYFV